MWPWLVLNSESVCLCHLSAKIQGISYHAQLVVEIRDLQRHLYTYVQTHIVQYDFLLKRRKFWHMQQMVDLEICGHTRTGTVWFPICEAECPTMWMYPSLYTENAHILLCHSNSKHPPSRICPHNRCVKGWTVEYSSQWEGQLHFIVI